jgi:ribonuclease BN (tRNA processing enzyme)
MVQFLVGPNRILYTSDYHHGPEVKSPAGEVDVLIHEATYPHNGLPTTTSHSSALQAGLAARESGSRLLFLCHFEVPAYSNGIEAAADEARTGFSGTVIVPNLYRWYNISDFL